MEFMIDYATYTQDMVGVKGFEPSTPASRTQNLGLKAALLLAFESHIMPFLDMKYASCVVSIYASCAGKAICDNLTT